MYMMTSSINMHRGGLVLEITILFAVFLGHQASRLMSYSNLEHNINDFSVSES
jgi:hypothetical protein